MGTSVRSNRPASLALTCLGVLTAPRWAGRRLPRHRLLTAIGVHVAALILAGGTLWGAGAIFERQTGAGGAELLRSASPWLKAALASAPHTMTPPSSVLVTAGTLLIVGEIFYWCAAIMILGSWMGANVPQKEFYRSAAVAAGFASLWLAPLTATLATAGAGMLSYTSMVGASTWRVYMAMAAAPIATGPAAIMFAMALRLAGGFADQLGEPTAAEDKQCERCGYNLHATPFESRCPSCGLEARRSRSPIHRCFGWEAGQMGFFATLTRLLTNPAVAFGRIPMRTNEAAARRFLVGATCLSASIFAGAVVLAVATFHGSSLASALPRGVADGLFWAGIWAMLTPALSMLAASLLNGAARRRGELYGARGALKITCYLSALAVPWALVVGGSTMLYYYGRSRGWITHGADASLTLTAALVGIGLFVWYWLVGARAYNACRYANT